MYLLKHNEFSRRLGLCYLFWPLDLYPKSLVYDFILTTKPPSENCTEVQFFFNLTFSLLIYTLKSDFEGGRKVVLQTHIFFWLETQIENGFMLLTQLFLGCRTTFLPPSKSFLRVQVERLFSLDYSAHNRN